MVNKSLPGAETLYSGYSLLFFFDNSISHSVYAKNALQIKDINKDTGSQQAQLCNMWFDCGDVWVD